MKRKLQRLQGRGRFKSGVRGGGCLCRGFRLRTEPAVLPLVGGWRIPLKLRRKKPVTLKTRWLSLKWRLHRFAQHLPPLTPAAVPYLFIMLAAFLILFTQIAGCHSFIDFSTEAAPRAHPRAHFDHESPVKKPRSQHHE